MKILLITPNDSYSSMEYQYASRENLGVEYLISSLNEDGHEVESNNQNIKGEKNLFNANLSKYGLIGFSLPFWEYRKYYLKLINNLSQRTSAIIIAGGHAATIGAEYLKSLHFSSKKK